MYDVKKSKETKQLIVDNLNGMLFKGKKNTSEKSTSEGITSDKKSFAVNDGLKTSLGNFLEDTTGKMSSSAKNVKININK